MRAHRSFVFIGTMATALWMGAASMHVNLAANPREDASAWQAQSGGAKQQNPVPSSPESIAAGKKLYDNNCAECHGEGGKGDGPRAPFANPTPPNLTDGEWKHGSSDGEIFAVIQNGVNSTDMPAFQKDIPAQQIWNVVNYVKSLGTKK